MRRIFILDPLIVIIEYLAAARRYFSNITELLEGVYQYQQQRIINFNDNSVVHIKTAVSAKFSKVS